MELLTVFFSYLVILISLFHYGVFLSFTVYFSFRVPKYTETNNYSELIQIVVGHTFRRVSNTLPLSVCLSKLGKGKKENKSVSLTAWYIPFFPSVFVFLYFSSLCVHHKFVICCVIYLQGIMVCCAHPPELVLNELSALSNWHSAWPEQDQLTNMEYLLLGCLSVLLFHTCRHLINETDHYFKISCTVYSVSFNLLALRRGSIQDKIKVPHATIQLFS